MSFGFGDRYVSINKTIIQHSNRLDFDVFTRDDKKQSVLVYEKNTPFSKDLIKRLIVLSLYVRQSDQELYNKQYMNVKFKTEKMNNLYNNISQEINQLLQNPQSLENIQHIQENVTDMVSNILNNSYTVNSFLSIMASDFKTHTHSLNVSVYAIYFGKHLGLNKNLLQNLGTSALLHDIGKSKIDTKILEKEGSLTQEEFKHVKQHSLYGWEILKDLGIKDENILKGVRNHHEKVDGSGYPDNLKSQEIHKFAKIIAICDVFDALTANCTYKDAVDTFNSLITMKKQMPNHFDERLLTEFILMFKTHLNS